MKVNYLRQIIEQAYIKGHFNNVPNTASIAGWYTWDQIKARAQDYAKTEIEFLDLEDKEDV